MSRQLEQQFDDQKFANENQLVNGVAMHAENAENFHIPPDVFKRHVSLLVITTLTPRTPNGG